MYFAKEGVAAGCDCHGNCNNALSLAGDDFRLHLTFETLFERLELLKSTLRGTQTRNANLFCSLISQESRLTGFSPVADPSKPLRTL